MKLISISVLSKKAFFGCRTILLLGLMCGPALASEDAVPAPPGQQEDLDTTNGVSSNQVAEILRSNDADAVADAITKNDTNVVAAVVEANNTNLINAAIAVTQTNLIEAVKADDEVSDIAPRARDETGTDARVRFYYQDGLHYELRPDGRFDGKVVTAILSEKRKLTGRMDVRLHTDAGWLKGHGDLTDPGDKSSLRRLRFGTYGRTYLIRPLTYGLSADQSDGDLYLKDAYVWLHDIPYVKSLKFGVFKPPFSLGYLQSSSTIPMMENATSVSAFAPGRRLGFQLGGGILDSRGTLYGGLFGGKVDDDEGDSSDSYSRFVTRVTYLPVYESEGSQLLHLGWSLNHLFTEADGTRFRARPESYLSSYKVDTGTLDGDDTTTSVFELAWNNGPVSVQGEGYLSLADDAEGDTHTFWGCYAQGAIMLTGESRPYNTDRGTFGAIDPRADFSFKNRHWGAFEWVGRGSYIDLTDGDIEGGEMAVLSTGINWYLTRRNRLMFNIGLADVNNTVDEDGELFYAQTRLQVEL
jgi:phosphate-selective porin OprO/OprP